MRHIRGALAMVHRLIAQDAQDSIFRPSPVPIPAGRERPQERNLALP